MITEQLREISLPPPYFLWSSYAPRA